MGTGVQIDYLNVNPKGGYIPNGSIADRLLSVNFDPGALRPYIYGNKPYMSVNGKVLSVNAATLQYDEWKAIDRVVKTISLQRLVGASDLQNEGCVYPLPNGMGSTVLQWQTQSDINAAELSMDGQVHTIEDRPVFNTHYLPLPIVSKNFSISARTLNASRTTGQPLDTTGVELATRKVSEKIEDMIFLGASSYAFGGGTLYGYTDYPNRNTVTLSENWDASGKTGQEIISDVLTMIAALHAELQFGPYYLYIPTAYDAILEDNYVANYPTTIRQRIMGISSIKDIRAVDRLTANNVLLVQVTPDMVKLVNGMLPTVLQWEDSGGMLLKFKVMAIMVPWIRVDDDSNCGIAHLS